MKEVLARRQTVDGRQVKASLLVTGKGLQVYWYVYMDIYVVIDDIYRAMATSRHRHQPWL